MREVFTIAQLPAGKRGTIGICHLPGLSGDLKSDLAALTAWKPDLVVSMTEREEMEKAGCHGIGNLLGAMRIAWSHLPIRDYGGPEGTSEKAWPELSMTIHRLLENGGRVLLHCRGGHGRSGMIALRLLVENGEIPGEALRRIRIVRPAAVETKAQADWASLPSGSSFIPIPRTTPFSS